MCLYDSALLRLRLCFAKKKRKKDIFILSEATTVVRQPGNKRILKLKKYGSFKAIKQLSSVSISTKKIELNCYRTLDIGAMHGAKQMVGQCIQAKCF